MIKIIIAEDHQSLIDGISLLMSNESEIKIVSTALDGQMLIDRVAHYKPDVVLTDIRMPKMDGVAATRQIKEHYPNTKVLAFTMFDQEEVIRDMLEAGADGYLLKNSSLETVKTAIKKIASGEKFYDPQIEISAFINSDRHSSGVTLSERELEILKCIAKGLTNLEIADTLYIGRSTVETHRKNMIRKLGLSGYNELMKYAIERKYD